MAVVRNSDEIRVWEWRSKRVRTQRPSLRYPSHPVLRKILTILLPNELLKFGPLVLSIVITPPFIGEILLSPILLSDWTSTVSLVTCVDINESFTISRVKSVGR